MPEAAVKRHPGMTEETPNLSQLIKKMGLIVVQVGSDPAAHAAQQRCATPREGCRWGGVPPCSLAPASLTGVAVPLPLSARRPHAVACGINPTCTIIGPIFVSFGPILAIPPRMTRPRDLAGRGLSRSWPGRPAKSRSNTRFPRERPGCVVDIGFTFGHEDQPTFPSISPNITPLPPFNKVQMYSRP